MVHLYRSTRTVCSGINISGDFLLALDCVVCDGAWQLDIDQGRGGADSC